MSEETRPASQGLPHDDHEAQRNLGQVLAELGQKAADGTVTGAAAWATKKVLDKISDRHPNDKEPPRQDPPPGDCPAS